MAHACGTAQPLPTRRLSRIARSLFFFAVYFAYLTLLMAPYQRVVVWPQAKLFPSRRAKLLRDWLQLQARTVLGLAKNLAGFRYSVQGSIEAKSCIVVMNHQSIMDIPLGVSLVTGPYPLIPARAKYSRGIPGISGMMHLLQYPLVTQGPNATRAELKALRDAAEVVARGERSLIIYPEGHRSRTGDVLPFMTAGLKLVLSRTRGRPLYLAVVDGLWPLRTFAETAQRLADTHAHVIVRGPYAIPAQDAELDGFIDSLRERIIAILAQHRASASETQNRAGDLRVAR